MPRTLAAALLTAAALALTAPLGLTKGSAAYQHNQTDLEFAVDRDLMQPDMA